VATALRKVDTGGVSGSSQPASAANGRRAGRFGVLVVLLFAFAGASSLFSPFSSNARPGRDGEDVVGKDGRVSVGRAIGRDYRLLAEVVDGQVRYTVTSAEGRVLARDMTAEDVYRMFPDLAPGGLHAGPDAVEGPLMMVEPEQ
jgi:hypothetical protein